MQLEGRTRSERTVALVGGRLIDGTRGAPTEQAVVVIEGERISKVGKSGGVGVPPGAQVIDVRGKTIMPGLINCHTHLCLDGSADPITSWRERSIVENVLISAQHAEATLRAGITTVRDLGGWDGVDLGLKQAIADGVIDGPRMLVSGRLLCMTGGHAHFMGCEVDSPDEARKAARAQLKAGADIIKLMATGGLMTQGTEPSAEQLTYAELRAAVEEAQKAGKITASHAQGTTGIKNAVRAGIDSIEHGFYLDDEAIEMMLASGTYYVPTLAAVHEMVEGGIESGIPAFLVEKSRRVRDAHLESFVLAREAGLRIAAGNDGGSPLNRADNLATELECMVANGMSTKEALASAHSIAAELLGMGDLIGTVEPGKAADLVVLDDDPLGNISAVRQVHLVMKSGHLL